MGCATQRELVDQQQRTLDSLRTENAILQDQVAALNDSLQFYDDIESGAYYRRLRTLRDRLTRLTYEVSLLRDGASPWAHSKPMPSSSQQVPRCARTAWSAWSRSPSTCKTYPDRPIRVEGHADNVPFGPSLQEKYPSNWELSAARAAAVARHLIDEHEVDPDRFGILGFGSTRPVADNDTAAGRWLNRRVRIAVLPEPSNRRPTELSW